MLLGHNRIAAQEGGKEQKQVFTESFVETSDVRIITITKFETPIFKVQA